MKIALIPMMAAALTLTDLEGRLLPLSPEYKQAEAAVRMAETRDRYVDRSKLDERARYERWIAVGRKKRR